MSTARRPRTRANTNGTNPAAAPLAETSELTLLDLTEDEADAIRTLTELQQALMAIHIGPVNERIGRALRRIEVRLGLDTGAIGTTHAVDSDTMTVQERPGMPPSYPGARVAVSDDAEPAAASPPDS